MKKIFGDSFISKKCFVGRDYLYTMLLAVASGLFLNIIISLSGIEQYSEGFAEANEYFNSLPTGVLLFGAGVMAPLIEEFIFRFLLFKLPRKGMPFIAAMLMSSVLFGAYHMNIVQGIYAFILGCLMCCLYEKSGKLAVTMLFHASSNVSVVLVGLLPVSGFTSFLRVFLLSLLGSYIGIRKLFFEE